MFRICPLPIIRSISTLYTRNRYLSCYFCRRLLAWSILIMKANKMHYFSNLFNKVLYMFRTCPLSIIRSISTLYTCNTYLSYYFCRRLLAWSILIMKANKMHYFSNLFNKVLYMFRICPLSIIRVSQNCIHAIGICHASSVGVC
jgi:hypothetical protein